MLAARTSCRSGSDGVAVLVTLPDIMEGHTVLHNSIVSANRMALLCGIPHAYVQQRLRAAAHSELLLA